MCCRHLCRCNLASLVCCMCRSGGWLAQTCSRPAQQRPAGRRRIAARVAAFRSEWRCAGPDRMRAQPRRRCPVPDWHIRPAPARRWRRRSFLSFTPQRCARHDPTKQPGARGCNPGTGAAPLPSAPGTAAGAASCRRRHRPGVYHHHGHGCPCRGHSTGCAPLCGARVAAAGHADSHPIQSCWSSCVADRTGIRCHPWPPCCTTGGCVHGRRRCRRRGGCATCTGTNRSAYFLRRAPDRHASGCA